MSGFRLTACNSIWIFIKTTFTHPRTPRYGGQCLSTHSGFRPLHSEVRQCSTHILTISMRHPAYRQRRPPLDRFRIIDYDLRLLSADFTELLTQIYLLHQRQSEYQCGRFKALPYHSTHRVISSASIFHRPFNLAPDLFSQERVAPFSHTINLGRTSRAVRPRNLSAFRISFTSLTCSMNRPERAPARPALAPATDRSWLSRIRNNQDYAEKIVIPKSLHRVL